MKADRLISIITLLQINKQMTAKELSKELEVSVRTIYRDIDSLSSMGVPIFSDRGTNGGIKLLGDYKTSLTGINDDEIPSLFLSTGDKILDDLGFKRLSNSTLLKFAGTSSPKQIEEIKNIKNYIYIDMNAWDSSKNIDKKDILSKLQEAIWNNREIEIVYKKPSGSRVINLKPLGIVCKKGTWYLVALDENITKTYNINSIEKLLLKTEVFSRPSKFSLEEYWIESTNKFTSSLPKYEFTFKVTQFALDNIRARKFIKIKNEFIEDSHQYITIDFNDIWQGVEFAFTYGKDLEIIKPQEAIIQIKTKALEVISLYK